jgi:hypothetical protein
MTGAAKDAREPGATLLRIARVLCNEHAISKLVEPTIADLQREIAVTRPNSFKRLRAVWRGYSAFWSVILVAPFASGSLPREEVGAVAFPDAIARLAVGAIVLTLSVVVVPFLGTSAAVVLAAGIACAIVIHTWSVRHPSDVPTPTEQRSQLPQINFSSTAVEGNIGGLIFVVGSVFIVTIGLPSVIWFLFAATAAGCVFAWWLVGWRASHPKRGLPENRIVLR